MQRRIFFVLIAVATLALMIPALAIAQTQVVTKGLGLKQSEFTTLYGTPTEDIMGYAYKTSNGQIIPYTNLGDPPPMVERTFTTGVSYEDAVLESTAIMPSDSVAVEQYVNEADLVVDVYTSEWLRGQFPDPEDWIESEPGTFIVVYGAYNPALGNEQVTRMVLAIGNNP